MIFSTNNKCVEKIIKVKREKRLFSTEVFEKEVSTFVLTLEMAKQAIITTNSVGARSFNIEIELNENTTILLTIIDVEAAVWKTLKAINIFQSTGEDKYENLHEIK